MADSSTAKNAAIIAAVVANLAQAAAHYFGAPIPQAPQVETEHAAVASCCSTLETLAQSGAFAGCKQ